MADVQKQIGDLGLNEGSLGHAGLHALAGCIAAEAQGADCAAGIAGGVASSVLAGEFAGAGLDDSQQRDYANLLGALAGFLASGGDAENVSIAASVGLSAITNNRQLHRTEAEWAMENAPRLALELGISLEAAQIMLASELLRLVSDDYLNTVPDPRVVAYVNENAPVGLVVDGQVLFDELDQTSEEYRNSVINIAQVHEFVELYRDQIPSIAGLSDTRSEEYAGQNVDWLYYAAARDLVLSGEVPNWQNAGNDLSVLAVEYTRTLGTASLEDAGAFELWQSIASANALATSLGGSPDLMFDRLHEMSDEEIGAFLVGRGEMVMNFVDGVTASPTARTAMRQALAQMGARYRLSVTSSVVRLGDSPLLAGQQRLDPTEISFSQTSVNSSTSDGMTYAELVASMRRGWQGGPVDVVNMPDGAPTSMDNRRLLAVRDAGVPIQANVHNADDLLTAEERGRFSYTEDTPPATWGEAIQLRAIRQGTMRGGDASWPIRFPDGSLYDPSIIGGQ